MDHQERLRDLESENIELRDRLAAALQRVGIAGTVMTAASQEQLLDRIVAVAARLVRAEAAGLYLLDPESAELSIAVVRGGGGESLLGHRFPSGQGLAGECVRTGETILVDDVPADRRWVPIDCAGGYVPRTILCAPLVYEGRTLGVLQLLDKSAGGQFDPGDAAAIADFAALAAWAIVLSRAVREPAELARLAVLDRPGAPAGFEDAIAGAAAMVQDSGGYRELADLARRFAGIGRESPAAMQLARDVIGAVGRLAVKGGSP